MIKRHARWERYMSGEAWCSSLHWPSGLQQCRQVLQAHTRHSCYHGDWEVSAGKGNWSSTLGGISKDICHCGIPLELQWDTESPFKNKITQEWAEDSGKEWVHRVLYHLRADGRIERYNSLLKAMLISPGERESQGLHASPPGSCVTNQYKTKKLSLWVPSFSAPQKTLHPWVKKYQSAAQTLRLGGEFVFLPLQLLEYQRRSSSSLYFNRVNFLSM